MAVKARYTRILVSTADLSGQNNSVTVAVNTGRSDVTAFQDSAKQWITQDPAGSIEHAGYFDTATGGNTEALLQDLIENATTTHVGVGFGTNANGYPVYVLPDVPPSGLTLGAPVSEVITVNGTWAEQVMQRAIELYTGEATATGGGTGRDLGAAGSAGGTAYLWVTAIDGTATNADITVESDSAATFDSPAATEATFTFSATGAYDEAMTGTIGRYMRVNVTDLGGATGITFVCAVVVDGVTM